MEEGDEALAALLAGYERRSIAKRRPAFGGQRRIRFGQHLTGDRDVLSDRKPGKRTFGGKGREALRLLPGHCAAEAASAPPQADRHEVVVGCSQSGTRKSHEHAALGDPAVQSLADIG
jgi:hypothetical protein